MQIGQIIFVGYGHDDAVIPGVVLNNSGRQLGAQQTVAFPAEVTGNDGHFFSQWVTLPAIAAFSNRKGNTVSVARKMDTEAMFPGI
jgi:hypothetical protein